MNKKKAVLLVAVVMCLLVSSNVHAFGKGSSGPDVYAAQGMLKSLGCYAGPIDGSFGPQMVAGVRYFQQIHGLPMTGAIDQQTMQSILWAYGNLKARPQQPQPRPQPSPGKDSTNPSLSAEEQRMVQLVNEERRKAGLSALTVDSELSRVARVKSKDMIDQNYFSHQSPVYGSPFDMMRSFGIQYRAAAENIACNSSVDAAHQALMQSQGHRENILNVQFTHIGIGIVDGGRCGKMFTQMFMSK